MRKIFAYMVICICLSLSLTGCVDSNEKPYYMKNGKIYECEPLEFLDTFTKIRYLKDGKWIYDDVYHGDIIFLSPEEVK